MKQEELSNHAIFTAHP